MGKDISMDQAVKKTTDLILTAILDNTKIKASVQGLSKEDHHTINLVIATTVPTQIKTVELMEEIKVMAMLEPKDNGAHTVNGSNKETSMPIKVSIKVGMGTVMARDLATGKLKVQGMQDWV